jgi:hypothetical protein
MTEEDALKEVALDSGRFALARPPPPVALFGGQTRISSLRDGATEGVENAGILTDTGFRTELPIEVVGVTCSERRDRSDTEGLQVGGDGFTDAG